MCAPATLHLFQAFDLEGFPSVITLEILSQSELFSVFLMYFALSDSVASFFSLFARWYSLSIFLERGKYDCYESL